MERGTTRGYGQFCPVAVASEVLTQRWTPLVLRELLCGSTQFNQLRKGVPLMSPSLLADRLRALEAAGVVTRQVADGGRQTSYHLTLAGEELRPLIESLGAWGRRWLQHELAEEQIDPGLLLWDMQRRLVPEALPPDRVVVHFEFSDVDPDRARWWLVLADGQGDVCLQEPGFPVDLHVTTTARLLTGIWIGDVPFHRALGPELAIRGPRNLARAFPAWFRLSSFAGVEKVERERSASSGAATAGRREGGVSR